MRSNREAFRLVRNVEPEPLDVVRHGGAHVPHRQRGDRPTESP